MTPYHFLFPSDPKYRDDAQGERDLLMIDRENEVTNVLFFAMFSPRCRDLPEPEAVPWAD